MSPRWSTALAVFALLAGCASEPTPPARAAGPVSAAADDNLNATLWTQRAVEHDLIYLQTYRDAQARLLAALNDPQWDALPRADRRTPVTGLKPAVVLDIDETVLDNSPYQARLVRSGGEFDEAAWAAWCNERKARALPGAVAFTRFAAQHGIAVIYLSNRAKDLDQATLANLRQAGFPVAGPQVFLGLGTAVEGCAQVGTDKGCRRQWVGRHYRVLMQFGDQLADFVTVPANTTAGRDQALAPYLAWIGRRWFVLPNPTYGAWEPALFDNDWAAPRGERHRRKVEALIYD